MCSGRGVRGSARCSLGGGWGTVGGVLFRFCRGVIGLMIGGVFGVFSSTDVLIDKFFMILSQIVASLRRVSQGGLMMGSNVSYRKPFLDR